MKLLALILCFSIPCFANEALVLKSGSVVPVDGVLLTDTKAVDLAKRIKGCEAERDALRVKPAQVPWGVIVAVAAGGLVVGAAAGVYAGIKLSR